jgi:hypothetical protein
MCRWDFPCLVSSVSILSFSYHSTAGQLTSVWKRVWKHKHIVCAPLIWKNDTLCGFEKSFHVLLKLPFTAINLARPSPNRAPWTDARGTQISAGNGEKIARDRNWLLKFIELRLSKFAVGTYLINCLILSNVSACNDL